ncbi:hypothetical protein B0T22DRAFT_39171 [Podospora appendiculata]|uniref:Uncharacterized protein n=1 Tax=Podospora appendiculata TaxID=314037 RepID=A0AAE0XH35_9PEZI|nr:hypothetical protein B0T22DRAFT_39171 [Podospora appendiculata]
MRLITRTAISQSTALTARRAFASSAGRPPFRPAPTPLDTLHVWCQLNEPDHDHVEEHPPDEAIFGGNTYKSNPLLHWDHWHLPDVSIATRAANLSLFSPSNYRLHQHRRNVASSVQAKREVHENPTESEEDVVADRSDEDPLPPGEHKIIRLPAGEAAPKPTEAEEDVAADRSEEDPLGPLKGRRT